MLYTPIIEDTFFVREVLLKIFFSSEDYVHMLYHEILMIHRAMTTTILWATLFAQNMINV